MLEQKLLATNIQTRTAFIQTHRLGMADSLSPTSQIIYAEIEKFYDKDQSAVCVDIDILKSRIQRNHPKHADSLIQLIDRLPKDVSCDNVLQEAIDLKKEAIGHDLSAAFAAGNQERINELMEQYARIDHLLEDEAQSFNEFSIGDLVEANSEAHKIRLWPKALQEWTGGAMRGHNILVFARPEVGKSLFTINLAGGFLRDGYKVLYIENEDPIKSTAMRLVCRLCNKPKQWVMENPIEAEEICKERNYENLWIESLSPGTFREIYGLVDKHEPDVVIINQLRNIWVGKCERVTQLERAGTESRNLAKKKDILVIGVTQAGDSATDKLVLEMGDIDFSNTGLPAQMDLIIGIGCNPEYENRGMRMISLPKNKLSGEHKYFPVTFNPQISKVTS